MLYNYDALQTISWGTGGISEYPMIIPQIDVVRGLELNTTGAPYGDMRLVAGLAGVPSSYYQTCVGYSANTKTMQAYSLMPYPVGTGTVKIFSTNLTVTPCTTGTVNPWGSCTLGGLLLPATATGTTTQEGDSQYLFGLPTTFTGAKWSGEANGYNGDWDIGVPNNSTYAQGYFPCGAFINRTSQGSGQYRTNYSYPSPPYFNSFGMLDNVDEALSPNRIMPSAGMFGSLPVGVVRKLPWQTLLFRPTDATIDGGANGHPGGTQGGATVPDHLIMDLFQMPVVQPYAISEPFSCSGKVNLNYQIAPFSYIKRTTALRGVLYSEKVIGVPLSNAYMMSVNPNGIDTTNPGYTGTTTSVGPTNFNYRYPIDRDSTMTLFDNRFTLNQPFIAASQICEMPLVPKPEWVSSGTVTTTGGTSGNQTILSPASHNPFSPSNTPAGPTALTATATAAQVQSYVDSFWNPTNAYTTINGAGTADNLRERPYTTIYPRVTTKSNVFEIHMKVQTILKAPGSLPYQVSSADTVGAEYQGSCIIERYLDPTKITFDPTNSSASNTLGPYSFRIVTTKQFTP